MPQIEGKAGQIGQNHLFRDFGGERQKQARTTYGRVCNSFAQLVTEYQEHSGAVNTSTSANVQYLYADGSANTIRPTGPVYPNSLTRVLNCSYGTSGGMDDALSRVASLIDNDGTTHLADYTRLGVGTFVQQSSPQPNIAWSLINGSGSDPYSGLDQFNRVVDNRWYSTASNSDLDRIQHGYDLASNRLWRKNTVADAAGVYVDDLYSHDGLYRLSEAQQGELNGSNNAIVSGTLGFAQAWGLDATGNWSSFWENDSGSSWNLQQTRTANKVNEITGISGSWALPNYDSAGNAVQMPEPTAPGANYTATYDAWNRLVSVYESGTTLISTNVYDGLDRRVTETSYGSTRHFYYTASWQVIEERMGTSSAADRQFVWGLRYIDDLILRDCSDFAPSRLYALQDPNWNVTSILDSTGTVKERYDYSAYGQPAFFQPSFSGRLQSSFGWETLYAGYRYDAIVFYYLARHRWLDYLTGRWLARDPKGLGDAIDLYEYVDSAPVYLTDPFGLEPKGTFNHDRHNNKPAVGELIYKFTGLTQGQEYLQLFSTTLTFECFDENGDSESGMVFHISGADLFGAIRPATVTDRHGMLVIAYCKVPQLPCCKKGRWTYRSTYVLYETAFPFIEPNDRPRGQIIDAYMTLYDCDGTSRSVLVSELGGNTWTRFQLKYPIVPGKQVLSVTNTASGTFDRDGAGSCNLTLTDGPTTPDYK